MRKSQAPSIRNSCQAGHSVNFLNCTKPVAAKNDELTKRILSLVNKTANGSNVSTDVEDKTSHGNSNHVEAKKKFRIVYGKQTKKKHKTWEGDGTLYVGSTSVTAKDEDGKVLGTIPLAKAKEIIEGARLFFGSKEVEIVEEVKEESLKRKSQDVETKAIKRPKGLIRNALPAGEDQFILPEPNAEHQWNFSNGRSVNAVIVDPWLAKKLRPHQKKGVVFMYECLMGFKDSRVSGAILADEMGLGKTLQCITLIWTMLRQGPYGRPAVQKVIIVTPSSLTGNWAAEFSKWLGSERLSVYVIDAKHKPQDRHPNQKVVIVSYEMLQRRLSDIGTGFDLMICDEAHRLKNSDTKASQALNELCSDKRVLLTGTPMQNDLQEFFALVDFANPNFLGKYSLFKKEFEDPIVSARQPEASEEERALGEEQAAELSLLTGQFVLRRTQSVLDSYLPGKKEVVVFCRPPEAQVSAYNHVLQSLENTLSDGAYHLGVISALRKVANHPALFVREDDGTNESNGVTPSVADELNGVLSEENYGTTQLSGKLTVLEQFLENLWKSLPRERVVLVSAFTQTLDLLEEHCKSKSFPLLRLDGATPSNHRTSIVSKFNSDSSQFVFLLSAKAGGVGLNLIGASRLVLFDSDWNPATDLQAMARIWRDGQRRQVYIYRLLTAGTIEEKIFQRQLSKQTLAGGIVDSLSANSVLLSKDDLKDVFAPCEDKNECWTHSSLGCDCDGSGVVPKPAAEKENQAANTLRMEELMSWEHHRHPISDETLDDLKLTNSASKGTGAVCKMTVTYTAEVATVRGFGCFLKLLFRWRGSIYKLVWPDLFGFLGIYYILNITYRVGLNKEQRVVFESLSEYCEKYSDLIPLSFVLGFYVTIVMTRWWDQYNNIPWPDPLAVYVSAHIHGQDERGRLMRRTIMRYSCLCLTMVFSMISPRVKKRFPTLNHFVEAGLLLENEKLIISDLDEKFPRHAKHWLPIVWAASIVTRARKEGRIRDDFAVKTIIDELNKYRGNCGQLLNYDTISVPLVYTQVVTLAVYSFLLSRIMARQWLDPLGLDEPTPTPPPSPGCCVIPSVTSTRYNVDLYFPVFLTLQFFFYMGWLKVAESLINPFGEDDDDFEVNWLVDRNLQVSYLIVDEMHHDHPELIKDQYWDDVFPTELPYTVASEQFREEVPKPSTADIEVPQSAAELAMPPSAIKIDAMGDHGVFEDNSSGIHFFAGSKNSQSRMSHRERAMSGSSSSSINTNTNIGSMPNSINRVASVTSVLKALFSRENSHPGGNTTDGMHPSQSAASLVTKGPGTIRLTDQIIEEVDEQMTIQSTKGSHARPNVRDIFQNSPSSRPIPSVPVDVPMGPMRSDRMFVISSSPPSDASPLSESAISAVLRGNEAELSSSVKSSPATLIPKSEEPDTQSLSSDDNDDVDEFTKLKQTREKEARKRIALRLARSISAQKAAMHGDQADTEALLSELISASGEGSGTSLNQPT